MPPTIPLIICIAFVFFLLRLERKHSPGVSRALWLPTIWMLRIASRPLSYWFSYSAADPEQGNPFDRTFMIILLCAGIALLIRRKFDWNRAIEENAPLIALAVFMLISIAWSTMPFTSFKRWTQELLAIVMAFVVLSEPSPRLAIESMLRRTIYILIPFSVVLIKYFPYFGVDFTRWSGTRMWIGVTLQKNSLSRLCIITIFYLIWSLTTRKIGEKPSVWKYENYLDLFLLAIAVWLLRGSEGSFFNSATSFYALCAALLAYLGLILTKKFRLRINSGVLIIIALVIIISGTTTIFTSGSNIGMAASAAGRDGTLTGRTQVWAALLPIAMRSPIIGSGFGGFWTPRTRELFQITGAHNGYLDVLLGLGFVGIVLVSIYYLSSCRKAHELLSNDFDWAAMWICFLLMALVHNMAESSIDTLTSQISAIILLFTVSSISIIPQQQK